jgi:hypothetical protein
MAKFRMVTKRLYWWPVNVRFPDPDAKKAGEVLVQTFRAQFEEIGRDEAQRLQDEIAALPPAEQDARQLDLLTRVIRGWDEDVVDETEQPIPFAIEELKAALQSGYFRIAVYRAYLESLTGEAARKGN